MDIGPSTDQQPVEKRDCPFPTSDFSAVNRHCQEGLSPFSTGDDKTIIARIDQGGDRADRARSRTVAQRCSSRSRGEVGDGKRALENSYSRNTAVVTKHQGSRCVRDGGDPFDESRRVLCLGRESGDLLWHGRNRGPANPGFIDLAKKSSISDCNLPFELEK
jgi:hypothetical protein